MAHVIIFTDRAPRKSYFDDLKIHESYLTYPAGAYKIATVLRQQGLKVIVVPNCLSFSYQGIKHIIEANSKDLLWVGVSSTLLTMRSSTFRDYRETWHESSENIIGLDRLLGSDNAKNAGMEMVWSTDEINRLSCFVKEKYDIPLLLGGAWVSKVRRGNLFSLDKNCYIITGYAEKYIEDFTRQRLLDRQHQPPRLCDNGDYDDNAFHRSSILWQDTDLVTPDSVLPLEVSRGCAFNCAYCSYDRKSTFDSFKNPDVLRDELIRNYETYGVTQYILVDDLYNDSDKKVRVLYDQVWSRLPFQPEWSAYMRLDMLWHDRESADIMRASGARLGGFGIETLDDRAGRSVGKGLGRKRILETLEFLKESWGQDVLVTGMFIAGLPHESLESIQQSMDWTVSTDLLFSYIWAPLYVTAPKDLRTKPLESMDIISKNNDKFGIRWVEPTIWENDQGVRLDEVNRMVAEVMSRVPYEFHINFTDYADLRMSGMTHKDIAGIRKRLSDPQEMPQAIDLLKKCLLNGSAKITERLDKILALSD